MRTRRAGALALASSLLIAGLVSTGANAAPPEDVTRVTVSSSAAQKKETLAYWTPAKMREAAPVQSAAHHQRQRGGAPQESRAAVDVPFAEPEASQPRTGRLFFWVSPKKGSSCSATATASANGDVITTAGHCVTEGGKGSKFFTDFVFVPGYDQRAAPHGKWVGETVLTTDQWNTSGDFNYDAAFIVLAENAAGQSLTDVVGSYDIAFNQPRGLAYTSYGYPAQAPFDGETLWSCSDTAYPDPHYADSTVQGIDCSMTGGSSGGPWLTGGSTINSVNSFGYRFEADVMYGPYFGDVIEAAYNEATAA